MAYDVQMGFDNDGNAIAPREQSERPVAQAPQEPETQANTPIPNQWSDDFGFQDELGSICLWLEGVEDGNIFAPEIRQIIDTITNLQTVEEFDEHTVADLQHMITRLRQDVPQIERQIMQFVNDLSRTRSVAFEVDFI